MQEGILFHCLYGASSEVYFCQMSCFLEGLDIYHFREAWRTTIARHPILRTGFMWEGVNKPMQVVMESVEFPWSEQDWRRFDHDRQSMLLEEFLQEDRNRPFDFTKAPLLRLALLRTGENSYYFVWSNSHILLDGWCRQTLIQEVIHLYERYASGEAVRLPAPGLYRDYIQWLLKQDIEAAEVHWREELRGFGHPTRIGSIRPAVPGGERKARYSSCERKMRPDVAYRLNELAKQNQVTMNTVVQGGLGLILGRSADSQDVIFGITATGRPPQVPRIESMVGLFINTLPLRVRLLPHVSLTNYLKGLQARQLIAREFEYTPLVQLQTWSEVPRGTPLFESILVFENYPITTAVLQQSSSKISAREVGSFDLAHYPLTLYAFSAGGDVGFKFTFDIDRIDKDDVERLLDHLEAALESFAASPEQSLGEISMLAEKERTCLLSEARSTAQELPQQNLNDIFEKQVRFAPDVDAVEFGGQCLSYIELNRRSNRLARYLTQLGAEREMQIGICLDRGFAMLIALLGVLKAGAAYLPLDPDYPDERLAYMLQDSGAPLLITDRDGGKSLTSYEGKVVDLNRDGEAIAAQSDDNLGLDIPGDSLAYAIYTSGSTGTPKGVHITHRALVNFLHSMHEQIGITSSDSLLAVTTFTFDIAGLELYLPLAVGAKIVVLSRIDAADGVHLAKEMSRVTFMQATPASWLLALDAGWQGNPRLKALCGGEAWPAGLSGRLLEKTSGVWNVYGPTETTIWSSIHKISQNADIVPIGKALANTQLYVLDDNLQLSPMGCVGDLYIGGAGLARGYWRRLDLTAEKFLPDPFTAEGGRRLYKTGDRARRLNDGSLEFIGRLDDQIKIRGYRIELGEIQAALESHPQIARAAVVLRDDHGEGKRLVAYFVPKQDATPRAIDLQKSLLLKLPAYMVPVVYVSLEKLPQTANGKIDRKRLPPPGEGAAIEKDNYLKPRDSIEANLKQIWEDVLNVEGIGVRDNFFRLGGHSLKALTLSTRIANHYGSGISFGVVFEHPTIEQMAVFLRKEVSWVYPSSIIPIQPDGDMRPFFCVHPLYGMAHCYVELSRLLGEEQPVYGFQAQGLNENQEPLLTIEEMAVSYVQAMRSVQPHGPYQIAGVSMGSALAFEMAQKVLQQNEKVSLLALLDGNYEETPVNLVNVSDEKDLEAELLQWQEKYILHEANKALEVSDDDPDARDLNRQVVRFLEKLKSIDRIPQDITLEQFRRILNIMAINGRALSGYVPQPYPDDALLVTSTLDPNADPTMGWGQIIRGKLEVRIIPGKHGECILHPGVVTLAQMLKEIMSNSDKSSPVANVSLVN